MFTAYETHFLPMVTKPVPSEKTRADLAFLQWLEEHSLVDCQVESYEDHLPVLQADSLKARISRTFVRVVRRSGI